MMVEQKKPVLLTIVQAYGFLERNQTSWVLVQPMGCRTRLMAANSHFNFDPGSGDLIAI